MRFMLLHYQRMNVCCGIHEAEYFRFMYRFLDLQHELPEEGFDKEALFAQSEQWMEAPSSSSGNAEEIAALLREKLSAEERYYLLHERMWHKGKQSRYIGHVVIAQGKNIEPFIRDALNKNDLRPMRILAMDASQWMFRFTDEGVLYFFAAKPMQ
jgi:hypothetical protein